MRARHQTWSVPFLLLFCLGALVAFNLWSAVNHSNDEHEVSHHPGGFLDGIGRGMGIVGDEERRNVDVPAPAEPPVVQRRTRRRRGRKHVPPPPPVYRGPKLVLPGQVHTEPFEIVVGSTIE